MNRSKFTGLIFMMLFSIIGIIWVQVIWIRKAININNKNFDYYAIASIRDAANSIESSRKMDFLNNLVSQGRSSPENNVIDITSFLSSGSYSSVSDGTVSVRITNQSVTQNPGEDPVITVYDTSYTTDNGENY